MGRHARPEAARIIVASTYRDVADTARWTPMIDWLITHQSRPRAAFDAVGGTALLEEATTEAAD